MWKIITVIAVLVWGWLLIFAYGKDEPKEPYGPFIGRSKEQASIMCDKFLSDMLKAPSTAKYQPFASRVVYHMGGEVYLVSFWVDAQNSFGAMLRDRYECKVAKEAYDRWSLIKMEQRPL